MGLLLLGLLCLPGPLQATPVLSIEDLRKQAKSCEERGDWLEACRWYDEVLRRDRLDPVGQRQYRYCLRRFQSVRRHLDPTYQKAIRELNPTQALDVYERILELVSDSYVDRRKVSLTSLFRQGLKELVYSLEEKTFAAAYLPDSAQSSRQAFHSRLQHWPRRPIQSRAEAREQVLAVVRAARREGLVYRPALITLFGLEFASGACNSLDEYTLFLTPARYLEAQATIEGKLVGVGLDLVSVGQHLEVARVYPKSPAQEVGFQKHDRILRIDRQSTVNLPADVAAEQLRGEPGSVVELEVLPVGEFVSRTIKLVRRPLLISSVEYGFLPAGMEAGLPSGTPEGDAFPIGLVRIRHFQESTVQELKEALTSLQAGGCLGLLLDLRGNPGGLFKSAVEVADLFLPDGVIVYTQSQFREYNRPYKAEDGNPVGMPVVVLVDGGTASSAEILAGALKDLGRARVVGQTTFGKGSIQCLLPLEDPPLEHLPGGIRITVAKFFSPARTPYSSGIIPTDPTPPDPLLTLRAARRILTETIASGMMMGGGLEN